MAEVQAIKIGKWSIGIDHRNQATVIRFDFLDHDPMMFVATSEDAQAIARAILNQYANPPGRAN